MGILRSVALGKSRKSAGELTFYQRIGVACFRQKPARSPGYKSSVPQRMQQSVFRFMKANMDAANLKSFVDLYYDAKPRKNKSETKMNMFYRAFMPHMVAIKPEIYNLPTDDLVQPALFLGTPATNNDKLTNGQLGDLVILSGSVTEFTMSKVALDQIIDKANTLISAKEVPFTSANIFVGVVGADPTSPTLYKTVSSAPVTPTLANDIYTFDITNVANGIDISKTAYVALLIAGKNEAGEIDITRRKFATDSAKLQGNTAPAALPSIKSASVVDNNKASIVMSLAELTANGVTIVPNEGYELRGPDGVTVLVSAGIPTVAGDTVTLTQAAAGGSAITSISVAEGVKAQLWNSPDIDDGVLQTMMNNSINVVR